ncbi:MAG: hypothetical protein L0Y71_21365 [Gemmataceae bacterium]|nr:hypothetical protein [Gemmataceae bacterium]
MDSFITFFSFGASLFSSLATAYFWMVRMQNERPCLKPHLADKEFFLGNSRDGVRQIGLKLGVIVANYSALPNAILGARLWMRSPEGWLELTSVAFDKQTPQPFNVPSLQTVLLRLNATLSFPYQDALEEGNRTVSNYLNRFLTPARELRIELRRLGDEAASHTLTLASAGEQSAQLLRAA